MDKLKSVLQQVRDLVGSTHVAPNFKRTAEIHPILIDDKDDDVVFVVYLYNDNNIVRQHGFRNHAQAEELAKNWIDAS